MFCFDFKFQGSVGVTRQMHVQKQDLVQSRTEPKPEPNLPDATDNPQIREPPPNHRKNIHLDAYVAQSVLQKMIQAF